MSGCSDCGKCDSNGERCAPFRRKPTKYRGIRLTGEFFDCALPVAIDSHSTCSFGCLYCFAGNTQGHRMGSYDKPVGQTPPAELDRILSGGGGALGKAFRIALKREGQHEHEKRPAPWQVGALADPFDEIERAQGWLPEFAKVVAKHRQPTRMLSKGHAHLSKQHLAAFGLAPDMFWICATIITPDDGIAAKLEVGASPIAKRLEALKAAHEEGVRVSVQMRPMLPGATDATKRHPRAYAEILERAREVGAEAVTCEAFYLPSGVRNSAARWKAMSAALGWPVYETWQRFGKIQQCARAPRQWTEAIMFLVRDKAHELGMTFAVSDPTWAELGDTGCCCGLPEGDPIWGNFEKRQAKQALLDAVRGAVVSVEDYMPEWADIPLQAVFPIGIGPSRVQRERITLATRLRERYWNNTEDYRSVFRYFQGALVPVGKTPEGNIKYRYSEQPKCGRTFAPWFLPEYGAPR